MRGLYRFLTSTVLGGLVVLLPLAILGYFTFRGVELAHSVIKPLMKWLPFDSVAGVSLTLVAAVIALIGVSFLAGLLAQSSLVQGSLGVLERYILSNIPGYTLMKQVGESFAGRGNAENRRSVLVRCEGSSRLGMQMETLPDGRLVVFVPNAPNAFSGSLLVVDATQIEVLSITIPQLIEAVGRLGDGLGARWLPTPEPTSGASSPPS